MALLAAKSRPKPFKRKRDDPINGDEESSTKKTSSNDSREVPPFLYHYKDGVTNVKYKVGDTKDFNGQTFYFCDAPWHKNKIKWHTHPADLCRVRKNWLKKKEKFP